MDVDLLTGVADWTDAHRFADWLGEGLDRVRRSDPSTSLLCVDGNDIAHDASPLGALAEPRWRAFLAAAFFADWACYTTEVDRVDFTRLAFVMSRFAAGFRVFWSDVGGRYLPVGYTGWYPIERGAYERLVRCDPPLVDRMVVPLGSVPAERPARFLYLFNYSIVPQLRGTPAGKALVTRYVRDVHDADAAGLAAIAVSNDGVRVATRFGLAKTGALNIPGESPEHVLTGPPVKARPG